MWCRFFFRVWLSSHAPAAILFFNDGLTGDNGTGFQQTLQVQTLGDDRRPWGMTLQKKEGSYPIDGRWVPHPRTARHTE